MATSILHIQVADYPAWRSVFNKYITLREQFGCQDERVLHDPNNPNEVVVILEWNKLSYAHTFAESHELRAAMKESGVVGTPTVYFLEDVT